MDALEIALPYGHSQLTVRLEADRFLGHLDPLPPPPLDHPSAVLEEALAHLTRSRK